MVIFQSKGIILKRESWKNSRRRLEKGEFQKKMSWISWKLAVELNFFSEYINQALCMCAFGKQTDACKLSSFIHNLLYNPLLKEKQRKIKTKTLEILANACNSWVFYSSPFVLPPDDWPKQRTGRKSISEIPKWKGTVIKAVPSNQSIRTYSDFIRVKFCRQWIFFVPITYILFDRELWSVTLGYLASLEP